MMAYEAFPRGWRCESVTFYTHLGEDDDGVARWRVTRMDGVAVFRKGGVHKGSSGVQRGDDMATLYVFERAAGRREAFVEGGLFDAMEDTRGMWTVHEDGRDRVYLGLCWDESPPVGAGRLVRPVTVVHNVQGRPGLRHVKVVCS